MSQELEVVPQAETKTLLCSNCNQKLLIVRKRRQSSVALYNIRVECPLCGDHSFDEPMYGQPQIIWPDGITPVDIVTTETLMLFKTKVTT